MNHEAYQKKTRSMSEESLRYVIQDCKAVLVHCPDSPKASYYADEICYCGMEIARRSKK